jgi:hypothetical protein
VTWICLIGLLGAPGSIDAELSRLEGHTVSISADRSSYQIVDVAGEGRPMVGIVERRGRALVLRTRDQLLELRGPLAVPRIAGPGYKVWVLGEVREGAVDVRRIGILRPPD